VAQRASGGRAHAVGKAAVAFDKGNEPLVLLGQLKWEELGGNDSHANTQHLARTQMFVHRRGMSQHIPQRRIGRGDDDLGFCFFLHRQIQSVVSFYFDSRTFRSAKRPA